MRPAGSAGGHRGLSSIIDLLKTNQIARIGKMGGRDLSNAYIDVMSKNIASNETATYDVPNTSGCLLFIQAIEDNTTYAIIASSGSANSVVSKGAPFEVGNTTEPGSGLFRVWSSGTRQISIKNTNISDRTVSVFVMTP
jgi:hypothetical protein